MSLLQIKKLRAPLDLRKDSLNTTGTENSSASSNATLRPTDDGVFTCYFARPVTTAEGVAGFDITINIYDECHLFITTITLNATHANIQNNNNEHYICFKITLSDSNFQRLGGCNIYVHVVINNSNAEADNHVQFRVRTSENYHETIKHTHIYDEKSVDLVYWSTQQALPNTGETEPIRENITLDKGAFIHVQTSGLWGKNVILSIYERGLENTVLARIVAPMGQNRKAVVVSMKYLLACYCNKTNTTYNENDPIDLNFYIKTDYISTERIEPLPLVNPTPPPSGIGMNSQPENNTPQANPFRIESADLHLEGNMGDQNLSMPNNGTVFIQVNKGDAGIVEPDRYRDFSLGYMCHIEGIGKLANNNNNTADGTPRVTIYPLHTYEIMLKDLIDCELVTLEEAIYLTTVGHNMLTLETRGNLEANFDKTNAPLGGRQLIDVFLDSTYVTPNGTPNQSYANSQTIRKLLAQIQHKTEVFDSDTRDNNALHYICRDAWQYDGSRANTRYDENQECPFGEFFLNYDSTGSFELYAARQATGRVVQRYSAQNNVRPISPNQHNQRNGIAFHQGRPDASKGCLTFNIAWNNSPPQGVTTQAANNYTNFNNKLYPNPKNNIRKLNFLCIDERHAITPTNDRRYHDLIDRNGTIQT